MNILLIALDLDGTLLRTDGKISERTKTALKTAFRAGIRIVIASGRIRADAASFRLLSDTGAPVISCNGAVVVNGDLDRPVFAKGLPVERSIEVIETIHRFGAHCHAYTGNLVISERGNPGAAWYRNRLAELPEGYKFDLQFTDDLSAWLGDQKNGPEFNKIMVIDSDKEKMLRLIPALSAVPGTGLTGSHWTNREVLAPGVSKGAALEMIAGRLGIPRERVMAVGDNENDLSMLRFAGYSVAMGNAPDIVKSETRFTTSTNDEDGVAAAIERMLDSRESV